MQLKPTCQTTAWIALGMMLEGRMAMIRQYLKGYGRSVNDDDHVIIVDQSRHSTDGREKSVISWDLSLQVIREIEREHLGETKMKLSY